MTLLVFPAAGAKAVRTRIRMSGVDRLSVDSWYLNNNRDHPEDVTLAGRPRQGVNSALVGVSRIFQELSAASSCLQLCATTSLMSQKEVSPPMSLNVDLQAEIP